MISQQILQVPNLFNFNMCQIQLFIFNSYKFFTKMDHITKIKSRIVVNPNWRFTKKIKSWKLKKHLTFNWVIGSLSIAIIHMKTIFYILNLNRIRVKQCTTDIENINTTQYLIVSFLRFSFSLSLDEEITPASASLKLYRR